MADRRRPLAALFMRCWLAYQWARNDQWMPRPLDSPHASAPGPDSDRVLIFGSGPAVGWGVLTNEIALPGSLARALTRRTGRGTVVELAADMRITVSNALPILRTVSASQFDVIVVILGANDAARLMPLAAWRNQLSVILGGIDKNLEPSRTFVTGIPPIASVPGFTTRLGRIIASHAQRMNAVTAELCESSVNATYVPLAAAEPTNATGMRDGQTYRKWATEIADIVANQLDGFRSGDEAPTDWPPDNEDVGTSLP